jgi:hypothetical protein
MAIDSSISARNQRLRRSFLKIDNDKMFYASLAGRNTATAVLDML